MTVAFSIYSHVMELPKIPEDSNVCNRIAVCMEASQLVCIQIDAHKNGYQVQSNKRNKKD